VISSACTGGAGHTPPLRGSTRLLRPDYKLRAGVADDVDELLGHTEKICHEKSSCVNCVVVLVNIRGL